MRWSTAARDGRTIRLLAQQRTLPHHMSFSRQSSRGNPTPQLSIATDPIAKRTGTPTSIPSVDELGSELGLTEREAQVTRLLVWGDSNKAIARKLAIQTGTVRKHVEHILRKFGAPSRRAVTQRVLHLVEPN